MNPEDCLRSLTAEALLWAHPERPLLPRSYGLQAVANAFVMLGLLPEATAEAILSGHRSALESKGFGTSWGVVKGELTVRPGAHGFWESRNAGAGGLRDVPLAVAPAGVRCPTSVADVCFEWVKLTPVRWELSFEATAPDTGESHSGPPEPLPQALSEISVTDDTGHPYDLANYRPGRIRGRYGREWQWRGEVLAEPNPVGTVSWLEFATAGEGAAGRVAVPPPAQVPAGTGDPPWPTPAECYLAALMPTTSLSISDGVSEAELGPHDTAEIVATVADSLLAVGALPVTSALLRGSPAGPGPGWHLPLVHRWGRRAHQRSADFRPAEHRGLALRLPLEHATAVIESVSAQGDLVGVQLYGHPWVKGEYWPLITPCFQVRAIDDAGAEHDGVSGSWRGSPGNEGSGAFWFWPPVSPARTSIRVIVSTLWEAAWAEVGLPR